MRDGVFFKLVDHGVNDKIVEKLIFHPHKLFNLPMNQKLKGGRTPSLPLGYSATNLDYGYNLPWAEIPQLLQSPQQVVAFATKVFDEHHVDEF